MSLTNEPHFEIPSAELATWIEQQGADRWWNVDGDPLLTGRLSIPCPGDELAEELRRINRVLLVGDPKERPDSRGQRIGSAELDALAVRQGDDIPFPGARPPWADNRVFVLCWKGCDEDWLLIEDLETTESTRADLAAGQAKE
jgi:hypothetical protein